MKDLKQNIDTKVALFDIYVSIRSIFVTEIWGYYRGHAVVNITYFILRDDVHVMI